MLNLKIFQPLLVLTYLFYYEILKNKNVFNPNYAKNKCPQNITRQIYSVLTD